MAPDECKGDEKQVVFTVEGARLGWRAEGEARADGDEGSPPEYREVLGGGETPGELMGQDMGDFFL